MAALIDIVNRALGYLGAEPLVSLDQATPLAAKVKVVWPLVRDDVLRDHPWNSCKSRVRLGQLATEPVFGFRYQYQLPADFLRLVDMDPADGRYQVEGHWLLSNSPCLSIVYIRREENPQMYDAQLVAVLSVKLAAELAYGVTSSTSLAQSLEEMYQKKLREAKSVNARESDPAVIRASRWVSARLGA